MQRDSMQEEDESSYVMPNNLAGVKKEGSCIMSTISTSPQPSPSPHTPALQTPPLLKTKEYAKYRSKRCL
tara:strand:+ start:407 stop:616 length:210 start_codon:yes stop_codon:yes gene_type:complete